ncbi:MAG TPA: PLP-dependent aminotransferase family protein [bacterium]|nr:PLP-dependent aminotransferase family protein [bacterium]
MPQQDRRGRAAKKQRWADLFPWEVARGSDVPLFRQIYLQLRSAVLAHRLQPGTRLPSTRRLAAQLGVSRTSVVSAYEQLLAEGCLTGKVGSGTFISEDLSLVPASGRAAPLRVAPLGPPVLTARAQEAGEFLRGYPRADTEPFARGRCHMDERSARAWRRLAHQALRTFGSAHLGYSDPRGLPQLREAVCGYLRSARAVRCEADQIVITAGTQQAIDIILRILLQPGDEVWTEDPHYALTYRALGGAQATVRPIPVDRHGMDVAAGRRLAPRARAAFVTPSHQHPLGVVLSMARRLDLLAWARESGAWIVEDDCDGEYRYAGRPLAALQGLDGSGRVIYVGTFNKVLFPGLRLGYAVVPAGLLEAFVGTRFLMDRHPPSLEQLVLAEFMAQGHFAVHIRRTRQVYQEARDTLVTELTRHAGGCLAVDAPDQGMHLVAYLTGQCSDVAIERAARGQGLIARALSPLYLRAPARQGLVLGYTGFAPEALRRASASLAGVLRAQPARARASR